jgi:hypothetical protein
MTPSSLRILPAALAWLSIATAAGHSAADVSFSSGIRRVPLVELYTSEGCSSCPPADRWLSSLKGDPRLWRDFTPIAFHVDYWDYIGWKDRFARPEYGDRQRRHAAEGGARVVYTPGVFRNGQEWRGWRHSVSVAPGDTDAGSLLVRVSGKRVTARFEPPAGLTPTEPLRLHVALLGMNLETEVGAGENRGRTLTHDFVVLSMHNATLAHDGNDGVFETTLTLPETVPTATEHALVAWIAHRDSQRAIQSVGGYLPTG